MKKMYVLAVALFTAVSVQAQEREKGTIELTPFVGYASSNYYGTNVENNEFLSSVDFGVKAYYYFNDRWSIKSGLEYLAMGTAIGSYEEKINYLTIPVNANWHFGSTRKWNLNFGPSIGFLMSAEDSEGYDFKDAVNSTQIGFNIGIGYKIEINENFGILIDYQSTTGLSKIDKEGELDLKNAHGVFNIGAVINLTK